MLIKPATCSGCSLEDRGRGYVLPSGDPYADILLVGEAGGEDEARVGEPFVGAAGGVLNRLLARNHQNRDHFRIDNVARCQPPQNWFDARAPWYHSARQHCTSVHLSQSLNEPHKVVVPLGGTALRTILGVDKDIAVNDWHGTVTRDPLDRFWIVPTFHPSFLQRGAMNLFGVVSFDIQQALRVAAEGYQREEVSIVVDPEVPWFERWVSMVEAAVAQDPYSVGIAEDIETPDKAGGRDEGLLGSDDQSYQITRINFAVGPDEGISVPYAGAYIALCQRLFQLPCAHYLWNMEYDNPRLLAAGHTFAGERYDGMWLAHFLQSDVPRGLGFWAPFYCRWGAWKHLAGSDPGFYAGCDGFKTWRTVTGVIGDLQRLGMWDRAHDHVHRVHKLALKPAQDIGVRIDRQRLEIFIKDLEVKQRRLLHEMQGMVPPELRPLTPKGGYKREPDPGKVHAKGTALKADGTAKKDEPDPIKQELYAQVAVMVHQRVRTLAYCCDACSALDVGKKHRCPQGGTPQFRECEVDRWFWQEPFNPDSPDQILAYLKAKKHKPGRAKKTGADSTDRETLNRLSKETKDPLYGAILKTRAVGKVKGTYGIGTLKRLDKDDRVHPVPTFKPSTHRLSYTNPNITNVITDRGGDDNLASGFRACVVATTTDPTWAVEGWAKRYE